MVASVKMSNAIGAPPHFGTTAAYLDLVNDADYWRPYAYEALNRHGLAMVEAVAGRGGTFPTLVGGGVAVKLFGHLPFWKRSHAGELAALDCVAGDCRIPAPKLLAHGCLFDNAAAPWPYLVMTSMPGANWEDASLSPSQKRAVAADLGRTIMRIRDVSPSSALATPEDWSTWRTSEAVRRTVLPPHLVEQVDDFVAAIPETDRVFVHGDLMHRHVFVSDSGLTGLIDWGDAVVADPHYELAQVHLNLFDGDKKLLRIFLDHANWPTEHGFVQRALAQAFRRQAVGLAQHTTMDVFFKVPDLVPLDAIATLDELADALFGV